MGNIVTVPISLVKNKEKFKYLKSKITYNSYLSISMAFKGSYTSVTLTQLFGFCFSSVVKNICNKLWYLKSTANKNFLLVSFN